MSTTPRDRILIIDDEQSFALSTQALLSRARFDCTSVFSRENALEALETCEFDAILCDINMAGNMQLEMTCEICKGYPSTPLVLITGYPSVETAIRALNLSVFDYVLKPFVFEQFVNTVKSATARGRILRTIRKTKDSMEGSAQSLSSQLSELASIGGADFKTEVGSYAALTHRNVLSSLSDMYSIVRASAGVADPKETLAVLDCPPLRDHRKLLEETVQVLEKTRSAFKSKDLAILRLKIEKFLADQAA